MSVNITSRCDICKTPLTIEHVGVTIHCLKYTTALHILNKPTSNKRGPQTTITREMYSSFPNTWIINKT